ncbi:2-oxoglutarate dehydrogenase E1 component [Spirochaeta lutea]|uniref:oxoglutarate dehydrogenase (succinyl-transferring) n=1 Tax=Spirochaeta lutea TaxID=1480694 RepID=A0A098QT82_9SPIO|nr:2-oxoglutarate dehydrogenase E1 component [Spirochaeta lutea]KGE70904.1 hypothetical protein DC28_13230 [Spirochaeta lutea]
MNNPQGMEFSPYVEELYLQWKAEPNSVDPQWQRIFQGYEYGDTGAGGSTPGTAPGSGGSSEPGGAGPASGAGAERAPGKTGQTGSADSPGVVVNDVVPRHRMPPREVLPPSLGRAGFPGGRGAAAGAPGVAGGSGGTDSGSWDPVTLIRQGRVNSLIWAYRDIGYLYAKLNPLEGYMTPEQYYQFFSIEGDYESLTLEEFGLTQEDLSREFYAGKYLHPTIMPLSDIIDRMKSIYCSTMGAEILHIQNKVMRKWLINHLEGEKAQQGWSVDHKIAFQRNLIRAEEFESFIHTNFIGQKRFSLEGAETLIPALRFLVGEAASHGVQELVFGMAHRGRLNVLCNAIGKAPVEIFSAFVDTYTPHSYGGSGDVKYHLGYSYDYHDEETGKTIHVSLVANPSHLEAVDPVVEGKTRGIQRRRGDRQRKKVVPILIHGDAAFSGQGVVSETLNLSQLKGYRTGGTVHLIVNNQIGFTTASRDARSTFFATDIAKSINIPIFHVNGDDPEAVIRAVDLAIRFRQKFATDVVVDMICYRRLGHNEADEPSFTHPKMYNLIAQHESVRTLYGRRLAQQGIWSQDDQDAYGTEYKNFLKSELENAKGEYVPQLDDAFQQGIWTKYRRGYSFDPVDTAVPRETLDAIARTLTTIPEGFTPHPKLQRFVKDRWAQYSTEDRVDWAFAESLAWGTILLDGYPVRLSGEDCQRGTFSQRHAVWWDTSSEVPTSYVPLRHITEQQGFFAAYDSPLSEFSVLGFEYGYSLALPDALIQWEAQFGDFVNGAQVIIDQFIVAGDTKWFRSSGLVMLLPHGYEGQGPEHSSAHLERFLSLCAESNIQVVNPTAPAQYFHLLRKQVHQSFRKPLIVMTPKSLLRHKAARSSVQDMTSGRFVPVIDDDQATGEEEVVLLCSGKVYYDLVQEREKRQMAGRVAIIRVEQLYPFPQEDLYLICHRYNEARHFRWVQEESRNRGAWYFIFQRFPDFVPRGIRLAYAGRPSGASPATGSHKQHVEELQALLDQAFA